MAMAAVNTVNRAAFLNGEAFLHEQLKRRPKSRPEVELLAAIIDQAVQDIETYRRAPQTLQARRKFAEAAAWIQSGEQYPFSFEFACELTGLNAAAVRARLGLR